jgi:predicted transcriptional regulator
MTNIPLQVHIGEGLEAAGERFIAAWERAERGIIAPERHVGFESFAGFAKAVTPKRFELVGKLRKAGPTSVRALSKLLKRDYKSVHGDVQILLNAGLIDRTEGGLVEVTWDQINAEMKLFAA